MPTKFTVENYLKVVFWLSTSHDFILAKGHGFILAAARSWFYSGCCHSMILFRLPPGHGFNLAAARPWFQSGCRQAMISIWLPPGFDFNHDFIHIVCAGLRNLCDTHTQRSMNLARPLLKSVLMIDKLCGHLLDLMGQLPQYSRELMAIMSRTLSEFYESCSHSYKQLVFRDSDGKGNETWLFGSTCK